MRDRVTIWKDPKDADWIAGAPKIVRDVGDARDFLAGLVIESVDGEQILVGDISEMGGTCDCCGGVGAVARHAFLVRPL